MFWRKKEKKNTAKLISLKLRSPTLSTQGDVTNTFLDALNQLFTTHLLTFMLRLQPFLTTFIFECQSPY